MNKGTYVNECMFKDHMYLFENKKLEKYKILLTKYINNKYKLLIKIRNINNCKCLNNY